MGTSPPALSALSGVKGTLRLRCRFANALDGWDPISLFHQKK
jgi:hypothetical protein